jgi:3-oxoacyl-[acyl-carrier protein] reductase
MIGNAMSIQNKVAVVAGGARDIGRAISEKLAAGGAKVVVNYQSSETEAAATVAAIVAAGGTATAVRGDMTKQADVENLVSATRKAYGDNIDILINVVGGLVARKSLAEMDVEFFESVMRLNVTSTFLTVKFVTPHMPKGSAIVNLSSLAGRDGGGPGAGAYSTAKGAVMTFTRALAKELGPKNIRANCVCPGMIATTFHDTFTKDEVRANVAAATPLRRQGQAREVADLVVYLASAESSFITGASVDINGGLNFS